MVLGVSYGRSIAATIRHLPPARPLDLIVVQLLGALGSDNPLIEGANLARNLAAKFGASYRYLYAPLVVEDPRTRDLHRRRNRSSRTCSRWAARPTSRWSGSARSATRRPASSSAATYRAPTSHACAASAASATCAPSSSTPTASLLDTDLNRRSISIGLDGLESIDLVVAAAGGRQKAPAILGALRSGHVDVLISDDEAIEEVLALDGRRADRSGDVRP